MDNERKIGTRSTKVLFEEAFRNGLEKHSSLKDSVKRKVDAIIEHPTALGEPLKGNFQGFYSCPVKKSFLIVYLYCRDCRKKKDDVVVACRDCASQDDETIRFVLFGPHDPVYKKGPPQR